MDGRDGGAANGPGAMMGGGKAYTLGSQKGPLSEKERRAKRRLEARIRLGMEGGEIEDPNLYEDDLSDDEDEEADEGEDGVGWYKPGGLLADKLKKSSQGLSSGGRGGQRMNDEEDLDLDALAQGALVNLPTSLSLPRGASLASLLPTKIQAQAQAQGQGQAQAKAQGQGKKISPSPPPPSSLAQGNAATTGIKRKAEDAAGAGAVAKKQNLNKSSTPPVDRGAAGGAGGGGLVTQAEVIQALKQSAGFKMLVGKMRSIFSARLKNIPGAVDSLKEMIKKVGVMEKTAEGESYIRLKQEFI